MENWWLVFLFVDGLVKHGFYEDTTLRMSAKSMDTVRYAAVRDDGQTAEEAVAAALEAYEPELRERVRTARVGRVPEMLEVRL